MVGTSNLGSWNSHWLYGPICIYIMCIPYIHHGFGLRVWPGPFSQGEKGHMDHTQASPETEGRWRISVAMTQDCWGCRISGMCTYIYMYLYIYICIYIYTQLCTIMCDLYIYIYICIYIYTQLCTIMCDLYIYIYVIYIYIYVYIYIYTIMHYNVWLIHTYIYIYTSIDIVIYIYIYVLKACFFFKHTYFFLGILQIFWGESCVYFGMLSNQYLGITSQNEDHNGCSPYICIYISFE